MPPLRAFRLCPGMVYHPKIFGPSERLLELRRRTHVLKGPELQCHQRPAPSSDVEKSEGLGVSSLQPLSAPIPEGPVLGEAWSSCSLTSLQVLLPVRIQKSTPVQNVRCYDGASRAFLSVRGYAPPHSPGEVLLLSGSSNLVAGETVYSASNYIIM